MGIETLFSLRVVENKECSRLVIPNNQLTLVAVLINRIGAEDILVEAAVRILRPIPGVDECKGSELPLPRPEERFKGPHLFRRQLMQHHNPCTDRSFQLSEALLLTVNETCN